MVDANQYFGGNYLKASDIEGELTLTITDVKVEQLDEKTKLVVHFSETDKQLVLNKINTTRIIKHMGTSETDKWPGNRITLVRSEVEYDGKDVPCIRVKRKEGD